MAKRTTQAKRAQAPEPPQGEAPTAEQQRQRAYRKPDGRGRRDKPWINEETDMIAVLHKRNKISSEQEQAARTVLRIVTAYRQEIGVKGFRSCLDDSSGGYDGGDGNPAVHREYDDLRSYIGRSFGALVREVEKAATQRPDSLVQLKVMLNKVADA